MINSDSKLSETTLAQMLFDLERNVGGNAAKAYATRSVIEENRALALRNYAAAFLGDRHLAQQNTEDLIHSRMALLEAHVEDAEDLKNLSADAKMQFLAHRNEMNTSIGQISQKLVEINGALEEVNRTIDNLNVQISTFNSKQLGKDVGIIRLQNIRPTFSQGPSPKKQHSQPKTLVHIETAPKRPSLEGYGFPIPTPKF